MIRYESIARHLRASERGPDPLYANMAHGAVCPPSKRNCWKLCKFITLIAALILLSMIDGLYQLYGVSSQLDIK